MYRDDSGFDYFSIRSCPQLLIIVPCVTKTISTSQTVKLRAVSVCNLCILNHRTFFSGIIQRVHDFFSSTLPINQSMFLDVSHARKPHSTKGKWARSCTWALSLSCTRGILLPPHTSYPSTYVVCMYVVGMYVCSIYNMLYVSPQVGAQGMYMSAPTYI